MLMDAMNGGGVGGGLPVLNGDEPEHRAALLAWQERQRRQRTLRMLMMFLMMLLLMEGDEPPSSRHRHSRGRHQHLRSPRDAGVGRHSIDALGMLDEDGRPVAPLTPAVRRSRTDQDALIRRAVREDPDGRYHALVRRNGGRDVEDELRSFLAELRRVWVAEEAVLMAHATRQAGPADDVATDEAAAAALSKVLWKFDRKKVKMTELDDLSVFHYPRNATGYYRGIWVRSPANQTPADEDATGSGGRRQDTAAERGAAGGEDGGGHLNHARNVTTSEVHAWAQARLRARKQDVGVLILPKGVCFAPPAAAAPAAANVTDLVATEHGGTGWVPTVKKTTTRGTQDRRRLGRAPAPAAPPAAPSSPILSLTSPAGRVAFQLYSRPVPAMQELSIVDGLVRLYDSTTTSFVSRRTDVLVRVKGVAVHGIGRMSVVSQGSGEGARGGRSVLGVRRVPPGREEGARVAAGKGAPSTAEDTTTSLSDGEEEGDEEDKEREEEDDEDGTLPRRRRLQAAVKQLSEEGRSSRSADKLLAQIRQTVMDLHASLYLNHGWTPDEDHGGFGSLFEEDGWESLFHSDQEREPGMTPPVESSTGRTEKKHSSSMRNVGQEATRRRLPRVDDHERTKYDGGSSLSTDSNKVTTTTANSTNTFTFLALGGEASKGTVDTANSTNAFTLLALGRKANGTVDNDITWRQLKSSHMQDDDERILTTPQQYVYPAPYVADDATGSLDKALPLPSRDRTLEANALACEFEMNVDVAAAPWTYGEWRAGAEHRLRTAHWHSAASAQELTRSQYLGVFFRPRATPPKEALMVNLFGDLRSDNCHFHSFVNVTAMRTNWEYTTAKAINYSFYMMLTCLAQIVILLRQLLHTQSQSAASNVSLLCIGWQTVLDAMLCISHIFLCLVMQPLFTAFASVAFFKLLIFCVIEMKYMAIIIQARNSAGNAGLTTEDLRRQITLLHLKCYGALMAAFLALWYMGQAHRALYVLLLYSFWVPQIVRNVVTESRKPMHPYYVYGMSATRAIAPIYVFAVRNNFLREVNPDFPSEPKMCQLLLLWIAVQTAVLYAQSKYGTRFMIPQRFLPPKFDYSRPIPPALLPRPPPPQLSNSSNNGSLSPEIELSPLLNVVDTVSPSRERGSGVARNRRGRVEDSGGRVSPTTTMSEDMRDTPTLDCVICYNEIDVNDRQGYMLAPCDHIFHRHCLEQWMDVKMECPICRCNLPSL